MAARLEDYLPDDLAAERFGYGLPFAFAAIALALFYAAAPGLTTFATQNSYAKLGILVVVAAGSVAFLAAGYLLRDLDPSAWLPSDDEPEVAEQP